MNIEEDAAFTHQRTSPSNTIKQYTRYNNETQHVNQSRVPMGVKNSFGHHRPRCGIYLLLQDVYAVFSDGKIINLQRLELSEAPMTSRQSAQHAVREVYEKHQGQALVKAGPSKGAESVARGSWSSSLATSYNASSIDHPHFVHR
ncbi:uncharacterized protein MYCFIDRAFT_175514 [Pseudocercospora fijiensis CIRAD86]|uniref:Uncharacterized protein n=1 Tax=Pseudocercospora fijiensis (strain CIRAD86) TaxID=383855 RepID=M3AXT5_PSEFD|nr:uncharacterized protein MYCFIDRAFT_175514 [Pseudocercospora fijiensis CIRAD86]EME81938.1 hypothetical protein MYCFIDRAFT_175514 [Pseudocercospora fijiensis CIRAD86]